MDKDYKQKIRKLLALAESSNEHEAKAALLKARALMAEHKLTEAEISDAEGKQVRRIDTGISYSKRRAPWVCALSNIIGENYSCQSVHSHKKGCQTQYVSFIGLEDDVEICVEIFRYAVDSVFSQIKRVKKMGYRTEDVNRLCNSFGYGFNQGLQEAFAEQQEENEQGWGLVLTIPVEVTEHIKKAGFGHTTFRSRAADDIDGDAYRVGYDEGQKFDPMKRLAEGTAV